jgi:hypothetical protein
MKFFLPLNEFSGIHNRITMEIRLVTILHTIDIANHVPNWINLLVLLITIVDAAADFRELKDNPDYA